MNNSKVQEKITDSFARLHAWCELNDYKGWDPYDGLNSRLFNSVPLLSGNRLARLAWIQFFKRSPLNLRPLTGVSKDYNPKALGLFLSGFCNLHLESPKDHYLQRISFLTGKIIEKQSRGWSGSCWGYNFDWQARAFYQPMFTPTVVATTFVGSALLDAYDITGDKKLLDIARSSCNFIMKDLNRTYDENGNFSFSYSPLDKSVVFNASLLGSRLLSRVFNHTREKELAETARKSVIYCCNKQKEDGSWSYGEQSFHQWIDNFHTGYNLECLHDYMRNTGDMSFDNNFKQGIKYYMSTFFTSEGIPRYYNNSLYPIDIHSTAQLIVTLCKTDKLEEYAGTVDKVLGWTIENMQSPKGYFYYQINRYFSSRIPYMRWAQAWMFYALSLYLLKHRKTNTI